MTPRWKKAVGYVAVGLLIGGFWYLNRNRPPWEEALRTIVVFMAVLTLLKIRLKRRSMNVRILPMFVVKAVLVVIAALAEAALTSSHAVGDPTLIVAIGLGLAVSAAALLGHRYFLVPPQLVASRPNSARRSGGVA